MAYFCKMDNSIFSGMIYGILSGIILGFINFCNVYYNFRIKPNKKCDKCHKKRIERSNMCKYHNLEIDNAEQEILGTGYADLLWNSSVQNYNKRRYHFSTQEIGNNHICSKIMINCCPIDISVMSKNFSEFLHFRKNYKLCANKFIAISCVKYDKRIFDYVSNERGLKLIDFENTVKEYPALHRIKWNENIRKYVVKLYFLIWNALKTNFIEDISNVILKKAFLIER